MLDDTDHVSPSNTGLYLSLRSSGIITTPSLRLPWEIVSSGTSFDSIPKRITAFFDSFYRCFCIPLSLLGSWGLLSWRILLIILSLLITSATVLLNVDRIYLWGDQGLDHATELNIGSAAQLGISALSAFTSKNANVNSVDNSCICHNNSKYTFSNMQYNVKCIQWEYPWPIST